MNVRIIKPNNLKTTTWSGGTTSEYYIYPEQSDYKNKDFLFRISSAMIEEKPARFTSFIGYSRYLTMLDNYLDLSINGRHKIYYQNTLVFFKSEDDVIANSLGKDFNIMIKEDVSKHSAEIRHGFFTIHDSFAIVFAIEECEIFINSLPYQLKKYDCVLIENLERREFDLISSADIVLCRLSLAHDSFF